MNIADKWYKRIGFDTKYDESFYDALTRIEPCGEVTDYDLFCEDGEKNFIYFLYFCEKLSKRYAEKGIPEQILDATVADLVRWLDVWSELKGKMYLGELKWLVRHLDMRLFRLGQLQFYMTDASLEIHLPAGLRLTEDAVRESVAMAKEFFAKYFPDYRYDKLTCHSWLLDPTLCELLPESSNILRFQRMFDIVKTERSDDIIKYVFGWGVRRADVLEAECKSSLAAKVKERVKAGGDFYAGYGVYEQK